MTVEIRIPDIGDVEQVEVIEICAAVGDVVTSEDALIVIESDKASMEVPAGAAGTVEAITVSVGDAVKEGDLIAKLASAAAESEREAAPAASDKEPAAQEPVEASGAGDAAPGAQTETLEIRVPDIGDAEDVVVIEVLVASGDRVDADDLLVVVESDKASMEIPAGHAGVVGQVHVAVGAEVTEGTLLVTLTGATTVAARQAAPPEVADTPLAAERASAEPAPTSARTDAAVPPAAPVEPSSDAQVYAGPAVRRLARELGVQLASVTGSGARGRIVKDDVKTFVKGFMTRGDRAAAGTGIPPVPAVDFSRFGPIEIQPMSRVRVAGAVNLQRSWLNLPHVTQHEEADVTELEEFRRSLKDEAARRGLKITPLAFIIKACCYALKEFPTFNASLDPEVKNFILKKYCHIGFAVDTPEGLVVPVIRDADKLGVWELSEAIADLAEKARVQKLGLTDMQGGTFSISSLGGIGGTGFTPLINAPEVAILGVSRLTTKPVWNGSEFLPRGMLPLSLSYDHRAINGAEAGRFLAALTELLSDIRRLAL